MPMHEFERSSTRAACTTLPMRSCRDRRQRFWNVRGIDGTARVGCMIATVRSSTYASPVGTNPLRFAAPAAFGNPIVAANGDSARKGMVAGVGCGGIRIVVCSACLSLWHLALPKSKAQHSFFDFLFFSYCSASILLFISNRTVTNRR